MEDLKKDSVKKFSLKPILLTLLSGVGIFVLVVVLILTVEVVKSFKEIQFTLRKPAIVKIVMDQYNKKQEKLDQDFTKVGETAEDRLLDVISGELKK
jgi:hypothetical protein